MWRTKIYWSHARSHIEKTECLPFIHFLWSTCIGPGGLLHYWSSSAMLSNNEQPQVVCSTARWLILSAISMFDLDYTTCNAVKLTKASPELWSPNETLAARAFLILRHMLCSFFLHGVYYPSYLMPWQHLPKQCHFGNMNISNDARSNRSLIRRSPLAGARSSFQCIECGGERELDIRIVRCYAFAWDFQGDVTTVQYSQ